MMLLRNFKSIWQSKQVYFFDCDGTLYLGDRIIPGAVELVNRLVARGKDVFFFTNNSSRSDRDYVKKLRGFGFRVERDHIIISTQTVVPYLHSQSKGRVSRAFVLGTPALKTMLQREGLKHDGVRPQWVVVGFDKTLTYKKLVEASRWIERKIPWLVVHPDRFCPTHEGLEPDAGAIAALIEAATGRPPEVILGKPHASMLHLALERANVDKSQALVVGDRLSTDIQMALRQRLDAVLVLSGETKRRDIPSDLSKKILVVSSVRDLLRW